MSYKELWSYFDQIRCINLFSRDDRYKDSKIIFDSLDIPIDYYRVHRHPTNGGQGAFESHIGVIKEAYYAGAENVLVFEDDISVVTYIKPEYVQNAIDFMENNKDWEIFFFGCIPQITKYKSKRTEYPNVYSTRAICAHSYVISRRGMEKLKNVEFGEYTIDMYYLNFLTQSYALYPSIFVQGLSQSDITPSWMTDLSSLRTISAFFYTVDSYAYYVNCPTKSFIPVILIIILWFVFGFYKYYPILWLIVLLLLIIILIKTTQS